MLDVGCGLEAKVDIRMPQPKVYRRELTASTVTLRIVSESTGGHFLTIILLFSHFPFLPPSPYSPIHHPISSSIRNPISTQEADIALATPLELRVHMGGDDQPLSDGLPAQTCRVGQQRSDAGAGHSGAAAYTDKRWPAEGHLTDLGTMQLRLLYGLITFSLSAGQRAGPAAAAGRALAPLQLADFGKPL
ncbi:hypothetical protein EVAR_98134_1 [Eumeta japonica]|uniref:Uncharacterized protein n=1 Tax=Eumeta variegata TaxID=151549 RepID=A0A4C1XR38_EUMVA|nr:hypothetical protein EVAR_98134_1 [Eumeta japonica]